MFLPFYLLSRRSRKSGRACRRAGFSLIEMLVVLTIFIIMLGVVLANFPAFRDQTALQLIAQEIAITIRQAQVYGIGTRAAGGEFKSHGLYFDVGIGADKKSFILYADKNTPSGFGGEDQNSVIEKFAIRGGAEIIELWGCPDSDCDTPAPDNLSVLDILFQRFYPEAQFVDSAGNPLTYSYVKIVLKSTRTDDQKLVEVWNTGQISVKNL